MYMGFCTLVYQYHENVSPVLLFAVHGFFFPTTSSELLLIMFILLEIDLCHQIQFMQLHQSQICVYLLLHKGSRYCLKSCSVDHIRDSKLSPPLTLAHSPKLPPCSALRPIQYIRRPTNRYQSRPYSLSSSIWNIPAWAASRRVHACPSDWCLPSRYLLAVSDCSDPFQQNAR